MSPLAAAGLALTTALLVKPPSKTKLPTAPTQPLPTQPLPTQPLPSQPKVGPLQVCTNGPQLLVSSSTKSKTTGAYKTLAAAAARARTDNYCTLNVRLAAGSHPDAATIEIDRPTEIVGPSSGSATIRASLRSRLGVRISIEGVTFDRPTAPALDVRHADAEVELRRVGILHAPRYGVYQEGGRLTARGLVTSHTTASEEGSELDGTAVHVGAGTQAELENWIGTDNGAHVLVALGHDTKVELKNGRFTDTGHHPKALQLLATQSEAWQYGAVVIGQDAKLVADGLHLTRSDLGGVIVSQGAKARLRGLRIKDILAKEHASGVTTHFGGLGLVSSYGATVDVARFRITHAEFTGLQIARGYLTAESGVVAASPIGVVADIEGLRADYDYRRCIATVRFLNDQRNLVGPPPQAPSTPGGSAPEPPPCPTVD